MSLRAMLRGILSGGCLFFAATLCAAGSSASSDPTVQAEVRLVSADVRRVDDPDVSAFTLRLGIRLTNRSRQPLALPATGKSLSGTTRIEVLGVQSRQPDGGWRRLFQSSLYDVGKTDYAPCALVSAGESVDFVNFTYPLLLPKTRLAELGSEPIVRLDLMFFCRQGDGTVISRAASTRDVRLSLPSGPQ